MNFAQITSVFVPPAAALYTPLYAAGGSFNTIGYRTNQQNPVQQCAPKCANNTYTKDHIMNDINGRVSIRPRRIDDIEKDLMALEHLVFFCFVKSYPNVAGIISDAGWKEVPLALAAYQRDLSLDEVSDAFALIDAPPEVLHRRELTVAAVRTLLEELRGFHEARFAVLWVVVGDTDVHLNHSPEYAHDEALEMVARFIREEWEQDYGTASWVKLERDLQINGGHRGDPIS